MAANDLTFGCELEVTIPVTHRELFDIGGYHRGIQIASLPTGWTAQRDGSIQADCGFFGVEIVSPVLKGADGLKQVKLVCEWLQSIGAKVNRSTGLHVHVGFDRSNRVALKLLVALVARQEKAIYASTGTRTREVSHYCQGIQNNGRYVERFLRGNNRIQITDRYHLLNVTSERPTVEFRAFAGTTNSLKVIGHILTCLGLVEKSLSMKKAAKWVAKTPVASSPIARGGEGQTALNRLFYDLGWTKGREKVAYGVIADESLPTIKEIKAKLMELAEKYDAAGASNPI